MNVKDGSTAAGAHIIQWPCDGGWNSTWTLNPSGGHYHIVLQNTNMCVNVSGGSNSAGTGMIQWPCQNNAANDLWDIVPMGQSYHIVSVSSGLCLNINGGSQSAGASIIQWQCQSYGANDLFNLHFSPLSGATLPSSWSPVINLPVNPIAAANLPNGKLLMWSSNQPYSFEGDIGSNKSQTYTAIFDPVTLAAQQILETSPGTDMFCPGTALLSSGEVLVNGGSSSPRTSIYDWSRNTWRASANMNLPRGYEADTLLSNGGVFTLGGSWSGGQGNKNGEVWTNEGGWVTLPGVPVNNVIGPDPAGVYRGDNHLWLFAQSNGMVFHAGPSAQMNWISTTGGSGSIVSAGNRGNDPFAINGTAALYDIGKILKTGGAPSYQQNGGTTTYASNATYLIDISRGPTQPAAVEQLPGMNYQRSFANSVVLPNGNIVVVGGQAIPQPFSDATAILVPEIWNPSTKSFALLKPMHVPRTYHSSAILLPDGRVFVGGGGQCGSGCAENHLNAEILTPPYLLNADGSQAARPTIKSAPGSATRGQSIMVTTDGSVASFVLMRLSSVTHSVNNDQRRIPLTASTADGLTYTLAIPADSGVVLPGYYMLFALDAQGVPSVSQTIQIPL